MLTGQKGARPAGGLLHNLLTYGARGVPAPDELSVSAPPPGPTPKPCFAVAVAVETLERLAPNVQVPEAEVNVRFPVAEVVVVRLRVGGYAIGIGAGA